MLTNVITINQNTTRKVPLVPLPRHLTEGLSFSSTVELMDMDCKVKAVSTFVKVLATLNLVIKGGKIPEDKEYSAV